MTAAPFFLDGGAGRIFCLKRGPAAGDKGLLLIPPFAEEMNRCRRLFAELGIILAKHGVATLLFDPYGTGDSDGDFADARWEIWQDDATRAAAALQRDCATPIAVFAPRLAALLALDIAARIAPSRQFLLAPQSDGAKAMRQFLRAKVAADLEPAQRQGRRPVGLATLEAALDAGETVEISGYGLHPLLYRAIAERRLDPAGATLLDAPGPALWLEAEPEPSLGFAQALARQCLEHW